MATKGRKASKPKRLTVRSVLDAHAEKYIVRTSTFIELKKPVAKEQRKFYRSKKSNEYTTVTLIGNKKIISRVNYVTPKKGESLGDAQLRVQLLFDKKEKEFRSKVKTKTAEFAGSVQAYYGKLTSAYHAKGQKRRGLWHGALEGESVALRSAKFESIKRTTSRLNSTGSQNIMMQELKNLIARGADYTIKRYRRDKLWERKVDEEEADE